MNGHFQRELRIGDPVFLDSDYSEVAPPITDWSMLPNVRAWYKSDTGVTVNTSTGVDTASAWANQSSAGSKYNAANGTAANQPRIITNEVNGYPVLRFDGTNDVLSITGSGLDMLNGVSGVTVYAVHKPTIPVSSTVRLLNIATQTAGNSRFAIGFTTAAARSLVTRRGDTVDGAAVTNTGYGTITTGEWYIEAVTANFASGVGSWYSDFIDTVPEGTSIGAANIAEAVNSAIIRIGSGNSALFYTGDIAEIIICVGAHTASQVNDVCTLLGEKYDIMPVTPQSIIEQDPASWNLTFEDTFRAGSLDTDNWVEGIYAYQNPPYRDSINEEQQGYAINGHNTSFSDSGITLQARNTPLTEYVTLNGTSGVTVRAVVSGEYDETTPAANPKGVNYGTVSITLDSNVVTGTNTRFTTDFQPNNYAESIIINGTTYPLYPKVTVQSVNPTTNTLTIPNHGYVTGVPVYLSATTTYPGGTNGSTAYYANAVDVNTVKLYNSKANAIAGGATGVIDITSAGSGTIKMFNKPVTTTELYIKGTAVESISAQAYTRVRVYPYTSAQISTYGKFTQKYGYFECRCKIPRGRGLWPAFWGVFPSTSWPPEWDMVEILGHDTRTAWATYHFRDQILVDQATGINTGTDDLTSVAHGQTAGTAVILDSTDTMPGGTVGATVYYMGAITTDTFKLYNSSANAIAGGATGLIDITSAGSGTLRLAKTGTHSNVFATYVPGYDFAVGYHTFALHWDPDFVDIYIDNVRVLHTDNPAFLMSAEPIYLIANLAVGGSWPGDPDGTTPFPANMEIDYIRVWEAV